MDEVVQLFDDEWHPAGSAPRSRVRRENLRHGATGVVVRDRLGRVYVHRRTDTKDVYPGMYDFTAGGVMLAGETPDESARREAAEELGVTGAKLRRIGVAEYGDEHTRYVSFQYEVTYDGPIRWQPEEVVWGAWMTPEELSERLDDPDWTFVPDSQAMIGPWLAERLADRIAVDDCRDSHVEVVEGRWVDRFPRRPEIRDRLLTEARVMPRLAALLPLEVPVAEVLVDEPLCVRHALVAGDPVHTAPSDGDGERVGAFLRTLHDVPLAAVSAAVALPLERFERDVLPRLPAESRTPAADLLARVAVAPRTAVVHGDLGPRHVLRSGGVVTAVIGWSEVGVGDPALDLAWALHGTGSDFAKGVADAYGVGEDERRRALDWHRLAPWYDVTRGLDAARAELVDSGLRGVRARL